MSTLLTDTDQDEEEVQQCLAGEGLGSGARV